MRSGGAQCLSSEFWKVGIEYAVCRVVVVGSGLGEEFGKIVKNDAARHTLPIPPSLFR